jgi:hypothetical protein
VKRRADAADLVVVARGMHAIGEQHHEKLAVGIDPQRRAGKTQVAEAARGKMISRR